MSLHHIKTSCRSLIRASARRWASAVSGVVSLSLLLFASAALAQAPAAAMAPTGVHVRVLPNPEVSGEHYTLGEVAELDGTDLTLLESLAKLSLGRSPRPGRTLELQASYLQSRIAREVDASRVTLSVPDQAQVMRAGQVIPADEIAARVLATAAQANADGDEVIQTLLTPLRDAQLPMGAVEWKVTEVGQRLTSGGTRTFRIEASVAGVKTWNAMARVRQEIFRSIVVAVKTIRRNEQVTPAHVALLRVQMDGKSDKGYLQDLEAVVGRVAKRPIGPQEWIHKALLEIPMEVREGGPVRLVYETAQVHFQSSGVALVDGKLGDFIPVRNLESGRVVYGVVGQAETVKVN